VPPSTTVSTESRQRGRKAPTPSNLPHVFVPCLRCYVPAGKAESSYLCWDETGLANKTDYISPVSCFSPAPRKIRVLKVGHQSDAGRFGAKYSSEYASKQSKPARTPEPGERPLGATIHGAGESR